MKKTLLLWLMLLLFSGNLLYGQYQIGLIPNVSPDRGIYKKIGYTEIDIKYGSPAVKDRTVWGHMAAYDEVWRAGANYATTIEFSEAVQIEGLPFEVKTDYVKVLALLIDERVSQADESLKWVIYLQGTEYLAQQNKDIPLALQWINTSESLAAEVSEWNKQFYPKAYVLGHVYWTKAKLLALNNDWAGALKYTQQLKEIQGDYTFYKKKQAVEGIDELEQMWIKEKAEVDKE